MKRAHAITACALLIFAGLACESCQRNGKTDGATKIPAVAKELPAAEQDRPPVAYWSFEEDTGLIVRDESGNGHDGVIMAEGKHTARVKGRLDRDRAIEFFNAGRDKRHETGCIKIPKMGGIGFTRGLTVELWVKFKTVDTKGTRFQLIGNELNDTGPGFHLFFDWERLTLRAGSASGRFFNLVTKNPNPAQRMFEAEIWYHVAAAFDGSTARLYVDGKEAATAAQLYINGETAPSGHGFMLEKGRDDIYIGAAPGGEAYGMEGEIDEVKLYDYARSAVQIMKSAAF